MTNSNRHLAWLLIWILKDGLLDARQNKWVYRNAIQYLRCEQYSLRNHDWHKDCMDILHSYRKQIK